MDARGTVGSQVTGDARAAEPTSRVTDAVLKVCSLSGPTCSLLLVPPPATVSQARSAPLWLRPLLPCRPSTLACSHQPCLLSGWPWGPANQRQSLASPPTLAGNALDRQSGQRPGPRGSAHQARAAGYQGHFQAVPGAGQGGDVSCKGDLGQVRVQGSPWAPAQAVRTLDGAGLVWDEWGGGWAPRALERTGSCRRRQGRGTGGRVGGQGGSRGEGRWPGVKGQGPGEAVASVGEIEGRGRPARTRDGRPSGDTSQTHRQGHRGCSTGCRKGPAA